MNINNSVLQVPLDKIVPNRFQPRIAFEEKALMELASSIKQYGIIQPIVVRKYNDKYEIIAGERRYKAATIAGLATVPVVVNDMTDDESAEIALIENIQRKDLTPVEEALSYQLILAKNNITQQELAKKLGVSQSTIANKIRLLSLSSKVQDALLNERISERHARALLNVTDQKEQDELLERIIRERLTVRQLDNIIKKDYDEEDVPLVDLDPDINSIRENTSDIKPISNTFIFEQALKNPPKEQTFFRDLGDEPISMGSTSLDNSTSIFSNLESTMPTYNSSSNEEIELLDFEVSPSEKVFDSISTGKKVLPIKSNNNENIEEINSILNSIRKVIKDTNNSNIQINEIDENGNYTINIVIKKEE